MLSGHQTEEEQEEAILPPATKAFLQTQRKALIEHAKKYKALEDTILEKKQAQAGAIISKAFSNYYVRSKSKKLNAGQQTDLNLTKKFLFQFSKRIKKIEKNATELAQLYTNKESLEPHLKLPSSFTKRSNMFTHFGGQRKIRSQLSEKERNRIDYEFWYAIDHFGPNNQSVERLQNLLREGADINIKRNGKTALIAELTRQTNREIDFDKINALISLGADINQLVPKGSPSVSASNNFVTPEDFTILTYLSHEFELSHPTITSTINLLIKRGLDKDAQSPSGNTALHYPCKRNATKNIQFLCSLGVRLDIPNNQGHTALDYYHTRIRSFNVEPEESRRIEELLTPKSVSTLTMGM